jgi:hypothetical protein
MLANSYKIQGRYPALFFRYIASLDFLPPLVNRFLEGL